MSDAFDQTSLAARLSQDAQQGGVPLSAEQAQSLTEYLAQMMRWNRTYNLTAIRDAESMRVQHLLDCLVVLPALRQRLGEASARLMDVGSGGGLPGVVLAIMQPTWEITCVDAVEKKTAFVRQIASVLRLPNLRAVHARVETIEPAQCDVVVSRAFASLADFAALAGRHVRDGGTLAAMKGRAPDDELVQLGSASGWKLQQSLSLAVPGLDAQRCLLMFERG